MLTIWTILFPNIYIYIFKSQQKLGYMKITSEYLYCVFAGSSILRIPAIDGVPRRQLLGSISLFSPFAGKLSSVGINIILQSISIKLIFIAANF